MDRATLISPHGVAREVHVTLRVRQPRWGGRVVLSKEPWFRLEEFGETHTLRLHDGQEASVVIENGGMVRSAAASGPKTQQLDFVGTGPPPSGR